MHKYIFSLIGIGFIIAFFFVAPSSKTNGGFSERYILLIAGMFFLGAPFLMGFLAENRKKRMSEMKAYFKQYGIKATATVLSAERTGVFVNNLPQYNFHLKVAATDGKQFDVSEKKIVDFMEMNNFKPGSTIPVYLDPKNKEKFFVCWDEAGKQPNGRRQT